LAAIAKRYALHTIMLLPTMSREPASRASSAARCANASGEAMDTDGRKKGGRKKRRQNWVRDDPWRKITTHLDLLTFHLLTFCIQVVNGYQDSHASHERSQTITKSKRRNIFCGICVFLWLEIPRFLGVVLKVFGQDLHDRQDVGSD
jgi:hypothetical protein